MEEEKDKGGRPLKFKTVEDLQEKIDLYFASCYKPVLIQVVKDTGRGKPLRELKADEYILEEKKDDNGNIVMYQSEHFTITGLALALDTSRKVLCEYKDKRRGFSNSLKRAKLKCENYAENRLYDGKNVAGVIFNLKNNYGWKDKTETEISGEGVNLIMPKSNLLPNKE